LHKPEWQSVHDGYNFLSNAPQCLVEQSPYNVAKFDDINWHFDGEAFTVRLDRAELKKLDILCVTEGVSRSEALKLR
jgi:Ribbon-helix-helix protein, copG family